MRTSFPPRSSISTRHRRTDLGVDSTRRGLSLGHVLWHVPPADEVRHRQGDPARGTSSRRVAAGGREVGEGAAGRSSSSAARVATRAIPTRSTRPRARRSSIARPRGTPTSCSSCGRRVDAEVDAAARGRDADLVHLPGARTRRSSTGSPRARSPCSRWIRCRGSAARRRWTRCRRWRTSPAIAR